MTVAHTNEEIMRPPIQPPLRLVTPGSDTAEQAPLLQPVIETLSDGEIGQHIGSIVTRYKELEQQREAKELKEKEQRKKEGKPAERTLYNRDAEAADDTYRRIAMATAIVRDFGMLDAAVETDFASVYRQADQRALQSTGSDEDAKELRRSMIGTMEQYVDHPVLRAARSIVEEVNVTGGIERRNGQSVILQRALAEVFEQQDVPPSNPET